MLAGGVGAAKFLKGLVGATGSAAENPTITVIGNTGDDAYMFGLKICPDLDSVMYTLGGGADEARGWGRAHESYTVLDELRSYDAQPDWFTLGDRDFATHIMRSQLLDAGFALTDVTAALASRWQLPVRLLPMSDDRVETHVVVEDPDSQSLSAIHFQEWWVKHRATLPAHEFVYVGADQAAPTTAVLAAIAAADLIVLPPSNPVVSIAPILAVPGIRQAVQEAAAPVVGVSPIVGDAPLRGMADACLRAINVPVSAVGVANHYGPRGAGGLLDMWIVDSADARACEAVAALGIECVAMNTIFDEPHVAVAVARAALDRSPM